MSYSLFSKCVKHKRDSYLEYKILRNEYKEWKNVFLHENRLFTNLLNISGKKKNELSHVKSINCMLS